MSVGLKSFGTSLKGSLDCAGGGSLSTGAPTTLNPIAARRYKTIGLNSDVLIVFPSSPLKDSDRRAPAECPRGTFGTRTLAVCNVTWSGAPAHLDTQNVLETVSPTVRGWM